MTTINQIKSLMKSGDIVGAEALCKQALEADPDNAELKMRYGICRELLNPGPPPKKPRKGIGCIEIVVLLVLFLVVIVVSVIMFGNSIHDQLRVMVGPGGIILRKPPTSVETTTADRDLTMANADPTKDPSSSVRRRDAVTTQGEDSNETH